MKKRILKCGMMGFLMGCFIYLFFAILVSLTMNTGEFYFSLPALTHYYQNELYATLIQIFSFLWFGVACGFAYAFANDVDLEPTKQGLSYMLMLTIGVLPFVWIGQWYQHIFIGIFSYFIIIAIVSLTIFVVGWIKLRNDIYEIKNVMKKRKEEFNEII